MLRRGFTLRHVDASLELLTDKHDGPWRKVKATITAAIGKGSLIILTGIRGTGKTQIATDVAAAMVAELVSRPMAPAEITWPRYVVVSDIFRMLRATFRPGAPSSEADVLSTFTRPSLLVIDEAHERGETKFEDLQLTYILDQRYAAERDTILITNQTREEFGKAIGPSVVSRVNETGKAIDCNWKSFREKRGNAS